MTTLTKPIKRLSRGPFAHYKRQIVVTITPGHQSGDDYIEMRLKGTRMTYRATFDSVFRTMALWHAGAERLRKAQERKAKRLNHG